MCKLGRGNSFHFFQKLKDDEGDCSHREDIKVWRVKQRSDYAKPLRKNQWRSLTLLQVQKEAIKELLNRSPCRLLHEKEIED